MATARCIAACSVLALVACGPAADSDAQAAEYSPIDYGASGDARVFTDGALTSGSNIVTSASGAAFTVGDVGKIIWCTIAASPTLTITGVTTVAGYTSATQVTIGVNANFTVSSAQCVLGTTNDTTPFVDTFAAASTAGGTSPAGRFPGVVKVPCGGYIVSGAIFDNITGSGPTPPALIGEYRACVNLYLTPTLTIPGAAAPVLLGFYRTAVIKNITIYGCFKPYAMAAGQSLISLAFAHAVDVENLYVFNAASSTSGSYVMSVTGGTAVRLENVYIQPAGGPIAPSLITALRVNGSGVTATNVFLSNNYVNLVVTGNYPSRGDAFNVTWNGGIVDECLASACTVVDGDLNVSGTSLWGNSSYAISVGSSGRLRLNQAHVGVWPHQSGKALLIAAGGRVSASQSTVWGSSTNSDKTSITNTGDYVDAGGNEYKHCAPPTDPLTGLRTCTPIPWRAAFTRPNAAAALADGRH